MHVTAKADYAIQTAVALVDSSQQRPSKTGVIAAAQNSPHSFLENILMQLRSDVRGQSPEKIEYVGSAESLQQVWIAMRANVRKVLEHVTVADVAHGRLPKGVLALTRKDDAWESRR